MNLKLCFLAPSTFGKSTAVSILTKKYDATNIKIAEPLYQLQNMFYTFINKSIDGEQDGELLQFYGLKIRKENPRFLMDQFISNLKNNDNTSIILNDDCRPYDYEVLKQIGFIFIKINGYPRSRQDHTSINKKEPIKWQDNIPYDYEIDNLSALEIYEKNLLSLMERIKNERQVLYSSNPKSMHL